MPSERQPVKIIHFADIHFGMENYGKIDAVTGLNSRLLDFQRAFQKIIDYAIEHKVDTVLFAGDAYKTREPTPTHQRLFAQGIHQITSAGIPLVMIVGNHDLPGAIGKSHTLDVFKILKINNAQVIDKPQLVKIPFRKNGIVGTMQIGCLPWLTRSQFLTNEETKRLTHTDLNQYITEKIRETIKEFDRQLDASQPSILVAHGTVEGAVFGSEKIIELGTDIIIPLDAIKRSQFGYVALGHIHQHQTIAKQPTVVYSGSIERIDFGEAKETKGFMAVEFKPQNNHWVLDQAKTKFISTEARGFETISVTIPEHDPNPTETIINAVKSAQINDKVVKVIIQCSAAKATEIREGSIREALQDASYIAAITKQIEDRGRIQTKSGYSDELVSLQPIDLLEKFLIEKQKSSSQIDRLKKYAQVLMEEASA